MTKTEDPYKALVDLTYDMAGAAALQPTAGIGVIVSPLSWVHLAGKRSLC